MPVSTSIRIPLAAEISREVFSVSAKTGNIVPRIIQIVNRIPVIRSDGEQEADFISCVTFGKSAEFAQKYLYKGMRIVIGGRISTGSYKDKDGKTIYTTDVIVEEHEFAQNKDSGAGADSSETPKTDKDGFMEAKDGEIPFD